MNTVGIDVSKGNSMVAVDRPFGEVVVTPHQVRHTVSELRERAHSLQSLDAVNPLLMYQKQDRSEKQSHYPA